MKTSNGKTFRCPHCSGSHFGRDTKRNAKTGNVEELDTVRCHDEHRKGCKWKGEWKPEIKEGQTLTIEDNRYHVTEAQ